MAGAKVGVREVRISAADGRGRFAGSRSAIRRLCLPAGTSRRHDHGGLRAATIGKDVVTIREILVDRPRSLRGERRHDNNIEQIRRNIGAYLERSGAEPAKKGDAARRAPAGVT